MPVQELVHINITMTMHLLAQQNPNNIRYFCTLGQTYLGL